MTGQLNRHLDPGRTDQPSRPRYLVVQTADPDDLAWLAAPYRTVVIEPLAGRKGSPG